LVIMVVLFSMAVSANPGSHGTTSELKSLSQHEIEGYLNGSGMGFSKVAELSHFPGPRHVLDLKAELGLTKNQIDESQRIYEAMNGTAKRYGSRLVAKERAIELLFSSQQVDAAELDMLVKEAAMLEAQIRLSHLDAHISQKHLLSETQIKKYDEIRGYSTGHQHHH